MSAGDYTASPLKWKRLGDQLVHEGRLTEDDLQTYLQEQEEEGRMLGQILVEHGVLTYEELTAALAAQLGIPCIKLRKGLIDPRVVHVVPKEKALRLKVLPLFKVRDELTLATADPHAIFVFDEIERTTGLKVRPVSCDEDDITEAIHESYQENISIEEVMARLEDADLDLVQAIPQKAVSQLVELAEDSPVINLTNTILIRAIRDGASDIHIEPHPGKFLVRVRIDGLLYEMMSPRIDLHPAVVSRLKIMAQLNIAERRLPQDGRMQVSLDGRLIDLRFSSMPGINGEKIVLRILDRSQAVLDLNKLGFEAEVLDAFRVQLRRPYGLILNCGPTGSGKTTTLYSALSMLNSSERNIITVEDPVEYQLTNVNQNQVKEGIGLNFATFIKHALRQDPDIIMVGEIRDKATAETAIQASLTGHMVLSTLHTNDSPSTITRLLEMGAEPYLIASALLASLAQRLLRTICPHCETTFFPPDIVSEELGAAPGERIRLKKGRGCPACYDSGYKGRIGVYELLEVDDDLQAMILSRPSVDAIRQRIKHFTRVTLQEAGYRKVLEGRTTLEEVKRVIAAE